MNTTLPDSGARTEFTTGAVRDSMDGKGLPHCIPPIAIRAMAKRFEDGASKYEKNNWAKGIPLSRFIDSIQRHLLQWSEGDTKEDHAGAVLWNAACMLWTEDAISKGLLPESLDDLPFRPRYRSPSTEGTRPLSTEGTLQGVSDEKTKDRPIEDNLWRSLAMRAPIANPGSTYEISLMNSIVLTGATFIPSTGLFSLNGAMYKPKYWRPVKP